MTNTSETEIQKSALLVMDVQPGITELIENKDAYLAKVTAAVDIAHKKGVLVIYVVVGFRPGAPEASAKQKERVSSINMINPQPVLTPIEGDIVVTKRRVSAFSGSDLEVILSAQGIRHLILSGIATSGVVLSTIREASDKDFQITILSDLCADMDAEVNSVLLNKVFPRQATVMTSKEWAGK